VYYAGRGEMLQGERENRKRQKRDASSLTFVTDGTLLGIKPIGSDAEHIIALDADAVDHGTDDGAGLG